MIPSIVSGASGKLTVTAFFNDVSASERSAGLCSMAFIPQTLSFGAFVYIAINLSTRDFSAPRKQLAVP
jgi:hypothetical protein